MTPSKNATEHCLSTPQPAVNDQAFTSEDYSLLLIEEIEYFKSVYECEWNETSVELELINNYLTRLGQDPDARRQTQQGHPSLRWRNTILSASEVTSCTTKYKRLYDCFVTKWDYLVAEYIQYFEMCIHTTFKKGWWTDRDWSEVCKIRDVRLRNCLPGRGILTKKSHSRA